MGVLLAYVAVFVADLTHARTWFGLFHKPGTAENFTAAIDAGHRVCYVYQKLLAI